MLEFNWNRCQRIYWIERVFEEQRTNDICSMHQICIYTRYTYMHKRKKINQNKCENPTFAILSELQFNGLFLTRNQYTNRKKRKWQINQKKYSKHTGRFMKKSWRVIKNRVLRCLFLKLEEFPTKKTKPNKCCCQYTKKSGVNLQQIFCLCHNKAANPPIWYQPCKTELRMRLPRTKMCSFWTNRHILGRNKRLFT